MLCQKIPVELGSTTIWYPSMKWRGLFLLHGNNLGLEDCRSQ